MRNVDGHVLAGRWQPPSGTDTAAVVNPATGEAAATAQTGASHDVAVPAAAARHAFPACSATPLAERLGLLRALNAKISDRADELAAVITAEVGTLVRGSRESRVGLAELCPRNTPSATEGYDLGKPECVIARQAGAT